MYHYADSRRGRLQSKLWKLTKETLVISAPKSGTIQFYTDGGMGETAAVTALLFNHWYFEACGGSLGVTYDDLVQDYCLILTSASGIGIW